MAYRWALKTESLKNRFGILHEAPVLYRLSQFSNETELILQPMSHFPWPHILMFYLVQPYMQKITFPSRHCLSKDHDPFPCPFPGLCVLWERVCICSQQQQRGGSLLKRFCLPRCWCFLQSQSSYVFL